MQILVLFGEDSPSIARLRRHVERAAGENGVTPIFVQSTDGDAVAQLGAAVDYRILPLDDAALRIAARLSRRMARPVVDGDPDVLQDKWGQRRAFARHGVPSPPFALVETARDVLECGERWGYPLMLKPSCGTESRGVRRVDGPDGVADALTVAVAAARATGLPRVIAEGYLDGPDVAVESMVLDGETYHVSFSQSGWRGDYWQAAAPLGSALQPHFGAIGEAIAAANRALGLRWAATSNELRVTAGGPMLVEANARLGGESCEDAILAHVGVDRAAALLAMLAGEMPAVQPSRMRPVAQTIIRASERGMVRAVDVPAHLVDDPRVRLGIRVAPGTRIEDPDAYFLGWLLVEGEDCETADDLLPRAADYARAITIVTSPL